ncbi:MAG: N-acetyltransferase [Candidatus Sumerlaeia bacterium]
MSNDAVRRARLLDVPVIHKLIAEAAKGAPIIPRSQAELFENLRDFWVYDEGNGPVGCCAMHINWHDLGEVKSLAVRKDMQGRGIARLLINACIADARDLQIERLFALTAVTGLFEKMGFNKIEKSELPHKVWGECVRCPKFPDCDEDAVMMHTGCHLETAKPLPTLP